jgi:hypothetical protein
LTLALSDATGVAFLADCICIVSTANSGDAKVVFWEAGAFLADARVMGGGVGRAGEGWEEAGVGAAAGGVSESTSKGLAFLTVLTARLRSAPYSSRVSIVFTHRTNSTTSN